MTDAALVAAAVGGDQDACAELVRRFHPICWRFAYRMLGDHHDAEDVVQETFLRLFRALGSYREQNRFRAWLLRILANQCRTTLVRRRRWRWLIQQDGDAEHLAAAPPSAGGSDLPEALRILETREASDALQIALGLLEPKYREAFLLKYGEGMEYAEMAQVTGVGISALKMRVKRACDMLRPRLRELGYDG